MAEDLNYGYKLSDYDFELPEHCIAQKPIDKRDNSKLLIYDRKSDTITHKHFYDIINYFNEDDILVLNNSKVIPAKLIGYKADTMGKIDIVLIEELNSGADFIEFSVITKLSKLKKGQRIIFKHRSFTDVQDDASHSRHSKQQQQGHSKQQQQGHSKQQQQRHSERSEESHIYATYIDRKNDYAILCFDKSKAEFYANLEEYGKMPLPPYIKRNNDDLEDNNDRDRYQTVYAEDKGSIAAPTAGLHFTDEILAKISNKNTCIDYLTLHVGIGTFKPIKTNKITEHIMMSEQYLIPENFANIIRSKIKNKKLITSVGTTSTRTLESFAKTDKLSDKTDLYIYPGHEFFIDRLITNFHVPHSTPLMLVSAFIADGFKKNKKENHIAKSVDTLKRIYKEAIDNNYRFYSYGDSMLVL